MKKIIRLTEQDLYKIVKRVIKESDANDFEQQIDEIIDEYGVSMDVSYEDISGIEIMEFIHNYDEITNSLKILKNMVHTYKDNFDGNKKQSFFQRMFSKDEREKVSDLLYHTPTSKKINRDIIELGRSYLNSNKIIPADEKTDMYKSMIEVLSDKIEYVKQLKRDLTLKLRERTNHLSRKGDK